MSGNSRRTEETWQNAPTRKGRKGSNQDVNNITVISKCSSSDLKEVFGSFGTYEGSYIARKLDRWGKRFAFVSFRDVVDAKRLEADMGDVWIDTYKLFVAVARFVDGNVIDRPMEDRKGKAKIANNNAHANPNVGGAIDGLDSQVNRGGSIPDVGGGRSFLDSMLNRNKVDVIKVDDNVEGFVHWHGVALVGKLKSNGLPLVSIKYMGGFSVVMVFPSTEDSDRFLGDKNMWSRWFEGLNRWDGNTKGVEERLAWLQVHGVPVQLALDQVFSLVGGRYGKVVQAESMSVNDKDFSYTYIGVLCKTRSRIADRVDINWRGVTYNVWIDEDVGEWVPDCVEDFEDDNDSFEQAVDRDVNMTCNYEERGSNQLAMSLRWGRFEMKR
ncbi:putative RNA recognition motif domain, nucleotide-binding alpha-beta plait domain superfamily [Helianthus annuus]|nr:putative RNA recognition motif domain, nucleotide-binding alpha-beta plait domain superfamily [Helianthus annuus]